MNILAPTLEFVAIADAVICKSTLPHREFRTHPMREASFDIPHDPLEWDTLRSQQQMNVIRHDHKSVHLVVPLTPVLLQHV